MSKMIEFPTAGGSAFVFPATIAGVSDAFGINAVSFADLHIRGCAPIRVKGEARRIAARLEAQPEATTRPVVIPEAAAEATPEPPRVELRVDRAQLAAVENALAAALTRLGQIGATFRITGERAGALDLAAARRARAASYAEIQVRRATQALQAVQAEQL